MLNTKDKQISAFSAEQNALLVVIEATQMYGEARNIILDHCKDDSEFTDLINDDVLAIERLTNDVAVHLGNISSVYFQAIHYYSQGKEVCCG